MDTTTYIEEHESIIDAVLACPSVDHEVEAGSLEWMMLRSDFALTASEGAALTGTAKWGPKTARQLMRQKREGSSQPENADMARGKSLEDRCRNTVSAILLARGVIASNFVPGFVSRGDLFASPDGLAWSAAVERARISLECKAPRQFSAQMNDPGLDGYCADGKPPSYYWAQIAIQCLCADACTWVYAEIVGDSVRWTMGHASEFITWLRAHEVAIKDFVLAWQDGRLPAATPADIIERNDEEWIVAVDAFLEAKAKVDAAAEEMEACKKVLEDLSQGDQCVGHGIRLMRVERTGSINWGQVQKALPQLFEGVDLEAYRGKSTEYVKIETIKKGD